MPVTPHGNMSGTARWNGPSACGFLNRASGPVRPWAWQCPAWIFLERVQHKDRLGKGHSVGGAKRVAIEVVHDFDHSGILKPL
jgi:hypothetical protein